MLYHFPQPYPDELFYSIIVRYSRRTPETNDTNVIQSLFDKKMSNLGKSVPFGISNILVQLKVFGFPSENEMLNNHTLFQYYINFISPVSKKEKYEEVLYGRIQGEQKVLNGKTLFYSPKNFRFCPSCMNEDIEKYGETYWRTSFQIPTVYICQKHKTLLEESTVSIYTDGLIPATRENCISKSNINEKRITRKTIIFLLLLAKESEMLAKKEMNFYFESQTLAHFHLKVKGLLDRYGVVKKEEFLQRIIKFFGLNFFEIINLDPLKFVDSYCVGDFCLNSLSYIEKLVLILFLAWNITNFITSLPINKYVYGFIQEQRCKNKSCKKPVRFTIYYKFEDNMRRKITILSYDCTCGINFNCILGDMEVFKESAYNFYVRYNLGEIYKNIREKIYITNLSIHEVSKVYNLHELEVEMLLHKSSNEEVDQTLIRNYREKWSSYIKANPKKHYLQLKYEKLEIYTWLYRNDRNWLVTSIEQSCDNELNPEFLRKRDFFIKEYLRRELHRQIIYQFKGRQIIKWLNSPFISEDYLKKELEYLPNSSKYVEKISYLYDKFMYRKSDEPVL
jgi:hypothetical protein